MPHVRATTVGLKEYLACPGLVGYILELYRSGPHYIMTRAAWLHLYYRTVYYTNKAHLLHRPYICKLTLKNPKKITTHNFHARKI